MERCMDGWMLIYCIHSFLHLNLPSPFIYHSIFYISRHLSFYTSFIIIHPVICSCIYLFTHHVFIHLSIHLHVSICSSIHPPTCTCTHRSIHPSIHPSSIHRSIHPTHLFTLHLFIIIVIILCIHVFIYLLGTIILYLV